MKIIPARSLVRTGVMQHTALAILVASNFPHNTASAQGLTSAGIRGTIRAEGASSTTGAHVRIAHAATGFAIEVEARNGRFLVQGLEPGGPYNVTVRQLGFVSQQENGLSLKLGELLEMNFTLEPIAMELDTFRIIAADARREDSHAAGGTAQVIGDAALHSLPTLNRDLYDFVRLVPQISTKITLSNPGFSAGGAGFRFNSFLINGISERTLSGSVSAAFAGAKSIPIDAVREYHVLLSPYDVRYGDFGGAVVNAVTRSGTNKMTGSIFGYARNDRLTGRANDPNTAGYDQVQYGASLGGPLIKDRFHFFVASELQRLTVPAEGPYVGQPANAEREVPVSEENLARLDSIMAKHDLVAGSAGAVQNGHPLRNLFSRLDLALPAQNSRLVIWNNYGGSDDLAFSRASRDTFSLSTSRVKRVSESIVSGVELRTSFARGAYNELRLAAGRSRLEGVPDVRQPIVRVSVPSVSGGNVTINTGTHETAQGSGFRSRSLTLKDDFSLPLGVSHILSAGVEAQRFHVRRGSVSGAYGTWSFASLDDLERRIANRYELSIDFGDVDVPLKGMQYAAYLGDRWQPHPRVVVTAGIRADMLAPEGHAPYQAGVDSIFGIRTDQTPKRRVEVSPRAGVVWNVSRDQRNVIRGGAGVFTARYPLAWAHIALSSYGSGTGLLACGSSPSDAGPPPEFVSDYRSSPTTCANGAGVSSSNRGDVDVLDRDLRMMRSLKASFAYERVVAQGLRLTGELLGTRGLSDFIFENLNLRDPQGTDRNGRIMYGSIASSGVAIPNRRSNFSEVISLKNEAHSRSYQLTARLEKEHVNRTSGAVSYTYSRARDAQTPVRVNTRGTTTWASARALSGSHDDITPRISANDLPHRVVLWGMHSLPSRQWTTTLSFYYVGESGRPFTYITSGTLRRGDLNADGTNTNDPVYIPTDAFDLDEIRFDAAGNVSSQQAAFEGLIKSTPCLRKQRGHIMERNSCREPWSNTTIVSVKQRVPVGHGFDVQLDLFNILNLLNDDWGLRRDASPLLLEHIGQTTEPLLTSQAIVRFDTVSPRWTTASAESLYQLQLAIRYSF